MRECYFEHSNDIARMTYGQSVGLTRRRSIVQLGVKVEWARSVEYVLEFSGAGTGAVIYRAHKGTLVEKGCKQGGVYCIQRFHAS